MHVSHGCDDCQVLMNLDKHTGPLLDLSLLDIMQAVWFYWTTDANTNHCLNPIPAGPFYTSKQVGAGWILEPP